jgi:phage baseplate assembly protein W
MADPMRVSFPLRLTPDGRTAVVADPARTAEQLIEELLFTSPGERLNRPQLGCGVRELVFAAATDELRAVTQFQIMAALQRWLGDVITVRSVLATEQDNQLRITIDYLLVGDPTPRTVSVRR